MKKLTAYENLDTELVVDMMFGKAMCAYENWQNRLKAMHGADNDTEEMLFRQNAIAAKNEYEATVRCIDMMVRESLYEIQAIIRERAEEEFGI